MKKYTFITMLMLAYLMPVSYAQSIEILKDLNTTGTSNSYPFDFTIANKQLFFIAAGNSGSYSLWVTKGTSASTRTISPGTGTINNIPDIISYNDKIYFAYDDGIHGMELWISDGTVAGTILFKDLYPGSTGSYPQAFTVANNKLFFMGSGVDGERRLYVSDGTIPGTKIIKNNFVNLFNGMSDFPVLNTTIYFTSDNGTGSGTGLWKSNGNISGTTLVKPDIFPGNTGGNYAVLNNKLYFSAFDYTNGSELWVSNGTNAGTHVVKNLSADGGGVLGSGAPQNLKVYNNKIYFEARDDAHGNELFVTDGTKAGTQLVKDIVPGTDGSLPYKSVVYKNLLYFICYGTQELWKTDGTATGTKLVKGGLADAKIAALWNNKLYLIVGNDYAVWQSNGNNAGTTPVILQNTNNPVYSLNNDFRFLAYKGDLYFSGNCNPVTLGFEPCKLTVTPSPLVTPFTSEVQQNLKTENTGVISALYNAGNKQITINNKGQVNFTWQLVSINGNFLSQGKSSNTITNLPAGNIAAGTYILICTSAVKTNNIRLAIF
jgi:ELWxxDGT repeat protein